MHRTFLGRTPVAHPPWDRPERLGYLPQLIPFVLSGEERRARVHLDQDAPQRPGVNLAAVRQPQDNLSGSVEPRLNVREVRGVAHEAAAAEVDQFHRASIGGDEEDVFGFEVAVHHPARP